MIEFNCGGALINLRYVVTAAECVQATKRGRQKTLVRLGEYEVTDHNRLDCSRDFCLEEPQDFDIESEDVILHPNYGKQIFTINDIALIRLPRTARENRAVRVVCLPIHPKVAATQLNVPDIDEGLTSYYATVVGWGYTEGGPSNRGLSGTKERVASPIQHKDAIPVLSSEQCILFDFFDILFDFIPRPDQICAGGEIGKGSCVVSFQQQIWF